MKDAIGVVGVIVLIVGGIVGASFGGYYLYAALAPKYEATRRDVMIQSRVYDEGTKRALYQMKRQYETASTDAERESIAAAARHEFQIFPQDRLPPDLQTFMAQVGG